MQRVTIEIGAIGAQVEVGLNAAFQADHHRCGAEHWSGVEAHVETLQLLAHRSPIAGGGYPVDQQAVDSRFVVNNLQQPGTTWIR